MPKTKNRPKPAVIAQLCKGCGRCIEACPKHCFRLGAEINPQSGLVPIELDLTDCNGCGLCFDTCPEAYALEQLFEGTSDEAGIDYDALFGDLDSTALPPISIPDSKISLPKTKPLLLKGTYAAAIGAVTAGCRHFFGYPITPSTEGAELLAKLLPEFDGVFVQAVSEVATVNMMYGCGGAGMPAMTFTSSPGFSLMLEGVSYMIGAEVPGVFVNVMRGGPGLGNIGPEQADIKLACRGLGHGNTHAIVLAPASPQEMLDLTVLAFELTFKYRNPVIVLGDGYLGQITGKVDLPRTMTRPGIPEWAVYGDERHRGNLICSIALSEVELEKHNEYLNRKYEQIAETEQLADTFCCDDAEIIIVAANTPSRMAKGAVQMLRAHGVRAGLFRPVTLWPFPIDDFLPLLNTAEEIVVVEASNGQLEDELRLALAKSHIVDVPLIDNVRHFGGILPQQEEIFEAVMHSVARLTYA